MWTILKLTLNQEKLAHCTKKLKKIEITEDFLPKIVWIILSFYSIFNQTVLHAKLSKFAEFTQCTYKKSVYCIYCIMYILRKPPLFA